MLRADELVLDHRADQTLQDHLHALREGDVDAILTSYSRNAVLVTPDAVLRGSDEIRGFYEDLLEDFLPGMALDVSQQVIDDDLAHVVWSAESADLRIPFAVGTLLIRQGTIMRQTFAAQLESR